MILAIDTSTDAPVIVLLQSTRSKRLNVMFSSTGSRSQNILNQIDCVFEDAQISRSDLEIVAVGTGPGAFTSLRIGAATGNGIAAALGIPVVGFSSLTAVVGGCVQAVEASRITGCIDAKRGEVFFQSFEVQELAGGGMIVEPHGQVQLTSTEKIGSRQEGKVIWGPPNPEGVAFAVEQVLAKHGAPKNSIFSPVVPKYGRDPDAKPSAKFCEPTSDDVPAIALLLEQSQFTAWTHEMVSDELRRPNDERYCRIVVENSNVIGCIFGAAIGDEWHLMNICIDKSHRRCGYGRSLLSKLIDLADKDARSVTLEVASSSTGAIELYKSVGFVEVGRRFGYYGNEDAVIMTRTSQTGSEGVAT